ncbi:MAG: hypothetical protein ACOC53_06480 [Candidatus Saliniplasma sp.]
MIQIICDEDGNPQKAGYSQHYGGDKRSWNSDDVTKQDGTHPEVYVAEGGHASYFESGTTSSDDHSGGGKELDPENYTTNLITNQDWLNFRGDWGEDSGSVPGAVFRNTDHWTSDVPAAYMWVEPIYWNSVIG